MKNIDKRYDEVYRKCIELCPNMQELIEKIRRIPPPKSNECKTMCEGKENGDSKALSRMIEMYLRTALRLSLTAAEQTALPLDEIFSEAVIGLSEAANRYDHRNHKSFIGCIMSGIRQGIKAYIRQNSSYIPLPAQFVQTVEIVKSEKEKNASDSYYSMTRKISRVTGIDLKKVQLVLYYTENPLSYEEYCKKNKKAVYDGERYIIERIYIKELRKALENAIDTLTEREKTVIRLKYGFGLNGKYTSKQIAETFCVDNNRIFCIEVKALRKLKHHEEIRKLWEL